MTKDGPSAELLRDRIGAACAFLLARQRPTGEMPIEVSADHERDGAWTPDPTVFAAAVTGLCLRDVPDERAVRVVDHVSAFLRRQRHRSGAWRFWTTEHRWGHVIPFDSDDTACAAAVLGAGHGDFDASLRLLVANRGDDGRFRTWVVPHRGRRPRDLDFWRCALGGLRHPVLRRMFWRLTEADPDDVDAVVCANVLLVVGDRPEGLASTRHLTDLILRGQETGVDKWYHRPLALHHAIARAARAAPALSGVRETSIDRVLSHRRSDGSFGDDALDTALALAALGHWRYEGRVCDDAAAGLLSVQSADGAWPASAYYTGGPLNVTRWGSRELTTAFCAEALAGAARRSSASGQDLLASPRPRSGA